MGKCCSISDIFLKFQLVHQGKYFANQLVQKHYLLVTDERRSVQDIHRYYTSNTSYRRSTSPSVFDYQLHVWPKWSSYCGYKTFTLGQIHRSTILWCCARTMATTALKSLIAFQMDITEDIDRQTESVDLILCDHIRIIIRYEDVPQPWGSSIYWVIASDFRLSLAIHWRCTRAVYTAYRR